MRPQRMPVKQPAYAEAMADMICAYLKWRS